MKQETVRMVTLKAMYYDRSLELNEEFDASPEHAQLLARVGSAKVVEKAEESAPKKYQRKDMRAED